MRAYEEVGEGWGNNGMKQSKEAEQNETKQKLFL
jgi:hypothetical protein